MLKSIVNGVEHDIVSIPMKTRNLWDEDYTEISNSLKYVPIYVGNGSFTLSTTCPAIESAAALFLLAGNVQSGASTASNGVYINRPITVDSNNGYVTVAYRYVSYTTGSADPRNEKTMLNFGSTALPYEPYGYQNGWEIRDQQDKLIWGREDTITGIPPFYLRTYGLPINTWELYGNSSQSTTPTPDNPIMPEFVGVRTENLFDINATPTKYSQSTIVTVDGQTLTITGSWYIYYEIGVVPNTEYYVKWTIDYAEIEGRGTIAVLTTSGQTIKNQSSNPFSFNSGENQRVRLYIYSGSSTSGTVILSNIMLNSGSTALPYEPYGYKIPFNNHGENLCNVSNENTLTYLSSFNYFLIDDDTQTITTTGNALFGFLVPVMQNTAYTVYANSTKYGLLRVREYSDKPSEWVGTEFIQQTISERCGYSYNFTTTAQTKWIAVAFYFDDAHTGAIISDVMLNSGNTAKPYSPYFNETTPVYLGQTPTVRRIKKLVLTGSEAWQLWNGNYFSNVIDRKGALSTILCTHFIDSREQGISYDRSSSFGLKIAAIAVPFVSNVSDLKAWLAAQYAAGTPITVWYILATPETAIVNEPLCKIGNYADELNSTNAEISIQTTDGINTLTVETEKIHGLTNPLCGIGDYKDILNLSTGIITRKIKKLVLTGDEAWANVGSVDIYSISVSQSPIASYTAQMCSHFISGTNWTDIVDNDGKFGISSPQNQIVIHYNAAGGIPNFKSYLAAQYSAGTPVTIWYALETQETESVTVPYGLECSVEGYLTQSVTPTPSNPITPDANGILELNGTYAVEVSLVPSNLIVKGHIKQVQ